MKLLSISCDGLEIARSHLTRPVVTIGRSPTCNVVLRAPGAAPIHFLLEWIGAGAFNPSQGVWTLFDISARSVIEGGAQEVESALGVPLGLQPVRFGGFVLALSEDGLEAAPEIGGLIREGLDQSPRAANSSTQVVEVVQLRLDTGAVEEVLHLEPRELRRKRKILRKTPELKLLWEKGVDGVKVLLEEMPGTQLFSRGSRVETGSATPVGPGDLLVARWRGREFYFRLVDRIEHPRVPYRLFEDPYLKRITGLVLSGVVIFALVYGNFRPAPQPEKAPPLRVATIVVEAPKVVPVKVVPPPPPEVVPQAKAADPVPKSKPVPEAAVKKAAGIEHAPAKAKPSQASAPRFNSPNAKPNLGLNSPAPRADVNSVGLLGALKKAGAKGVGVKAENLINEGVVTEAATSQGAAKIVIHNSASGVLTEQNGSGNPQGAGAGLSGASTTLAGAGDYDPAAVGAIARKGGHGLGAGTGLSEGGSGVGGGLSSGDADGAGFSVEGGGLDRETVRRIIASYRGQVRTCYERALLSKSRPQGRVVFAWTIGPTGPVLEAQISSATVDSGQLKSCVLGVIRTMAFPKAPNGKPTRVIFPFVFQANG